MKPIIPDEKIRARIHHGRFSETPFFFIALPVIPIVEYVMSGKIPGFEISGVVWFSLD